MNKDYYILGSCFPAELGGPSNSIYRIIKKIKNDNNIILSTKSGLTEQHLLDYDITYNELSIVNGVPIRFFDFMFSHKFSIRMILFILKNVNKGDSIHINSLFYPLSLVVMLVSFLKGIKFSIAPRGELIPQAINGSKFKTLYLFLTSPLFKKAKKVIVTSKAEKKAVKAFFPLSDIEIIPNYLDLPPGDIDNTQIKKNILYLGRLNPHKCVENLIQAYKNLGKEFWDLHDLVIAGSGESSYVKKLKSLAIDCESIKFIGHKTGHEKNELYLHSKLFVLPSKSENFGNVVIEALHAGTPVLACYNSPWEELVKNNCGYFTENSTESIYSAIVKHFSLDTDEQKKMERNAISFVNKNYLLDNNVDVVIKGFML